VRPAWWRLIVPLALLLGLLVLAPAARGAGGDLDRTFGGDGKVLTDFGAVEGVAAVAVQSDGKIVAAGSTGSGGSSSDFALARYRHDGSLDGSFGGDGKVVTDFGSLDDLHDLAIQPDGKIVAAGRTASGPFMLARYRPDGSLDPSFDGDGKLLTEFQSEFITEFSVATQADGKIVAAGDIVDGGEGNFALARYNTDGSPDPTFDGDGKVFTRVGCPGAPVFDVAIQGDGKIVVGGEVCFKSALARYNADGSLDRTFDGDGLVVTAHSGGDAARSIAIQTDGKIVAAVGDSCCGSGRSDDFVLDRYKADGSLDPTFDGDGKVFTDLGGRDLTHGVAIQPDGKLVAVGFRYVDANRVDSALARYRRDGRLDPTFDGDGKLVTDFGASGGASSVAVQSDGKIVAAGAAGGNFAVARYVAFKCGGLPATIVGTTGNDNLPGTAGNDVIIGFEGNDTISGLRGSDKVCGGPGSDSLTGGVGGDSLTGGSGADQLNGGSGIDTATYVTHTGGVTVDIDGIADDGNATDGPAGARDNVKTDVENLIGGKGADTLRGNAANNRLTGWLGADSLLGLGGDDTLFANDGTADTKINCDGGAADMAHVDPVDPATVGCETVGP
jgi:uncharacterized delta-60 repeat protein